MEKARIVKSKGYNIGESSPSIFILLTLVLRSVLEDLWIVGVKAAWSGMHLWRAILP